MSLIYIEVKSMAGAWIEDVAKEMVDLSRRVGIDVLTTFNGARVWVNPDSRWESVVAQFHATLERAPKCPNT